MANVSDVLRFKHKRVYSFMRPEATKPTQHPDGREFKCKKKSKNIKFKANDYNSHVCIIGNGIRGFILWAGW